MALAEAFQKAFLEAEPKNRQKDAPKNNTAWTEHVVRTASEILKHWGLYVASKESPDDFGRSEYMNLDACCLENGHPKHGDDEVSFPFPAVTIEVENDTRKILYDYWKLLCVRSKLRVLMFVVPEPDAVLLEPDPRAIWLDRLAKMRLEHDISGEDLLLVGRFNMALDSNKKYEPYLWRAGAFVPPSLRV